MPKLCYLYDERLSFRDKGIMAFLISAQISGKKVNLGSLARTYKLRECVDTLRRAVKKLKDLGYIQIETIRGERGLITGIIYYLKEWKDEQLSIEIPVVAKESENYEE